MITLCCFSCCTLCTLFGGSVPPPSLSPPSVSFPPSLPVYSLILSQNSRYSLFCRHPFRTSRFSQDRSINDGIVTGSHSLSLSLSRIAFRETCRSRVFVFILTPLSIPSVPRTSPRKVRRRSCGAGVDVFSKCLHAWVRIYTRTSIDRSFYFVTLQEYTVSTREMRRKSHV